MLQVCFLTWVCLFSPLIWGNTLGLWQKSCPINQCLSACVGCVLAAKRQDMICTYLCSHSWHSLCCLPDKLPGVWSRTTCVLCRGSPYQAVGFCNHPQHVSLMCFFQCDFSLECLWGVCVCVCVWKGMHAMTVCGLNRICPRATEENVLIPAKMKGFIFNTFFSEELICNNRGVFLYRCLRALLDLEFVCISMIS